MAFRFFLSTLRAGRSSGRAALHPCPDHRTFLMAISPDFQAQFDRLDQAAAAVDSYVAGKVAAAVSEANAASASAAQQAAQDHADEVAALTAQVDALTAKLNG